jgi:hypothetical protein
MSFRIHNRYRKAMDIKCLDTAYHESGHAVAAWSFGYDLESVTIVPDGRSMGCLFLTNPTLGIKKDEWLAPGSLGKPGDGNEAIIKCIANYCMIALAGPLAERRHNPRSQWRVGSGLAWAQSEKNIDEFFKSDSDMTKAALCITNLHDLNTPPNVLNEYLHQLEIETDALIERYWPEIDCLAQALFDRKTLIGDDLLGVIESVSAGAHGSQNIGR